MKPHTTSAQKSGGGRLELAARRAIERQGGSALDDKAWRRVRDRLVEFVLTLQRWDDRLKIAASGEKKGPCKEKQTAA